MFHNFSLINSSYLHTINAQNFDDIALAAFHYQYRNNVLYRSFTDALHIAPAAVTAIEQIPFLPIPFFKTYQVKTGDWAAHSMIFESSGTTGDIPSRHYI
ncbi:MAG: acyl transferase, partial [Flavipsychrobacter sp.]